MGRIRVLAAAVVLGLACAPQATQPANTPIRIGVIFGITRDLGPPRLDALRAGMTALGYVDGRHVTFEVRYLDGQGIDAAAAMVTELIEGGARMIVTGNPTAVEGARRATKTVPIVLAGVGPNPVGLGWVASLDRPGGNLTGLSYQVPTLAGRRLQLLKDIVGVERVGILNDATSPPSVLKDIEDAARAQRLELEVISAKELPEIADALATFEAKGIRAAFVTVGSAFPVRMPAINAAANARRIATGWGIPEGPRAGGLLGLGPDQLDLYRRSAAYVDKILKGADPGQLPVQQPEKFELVLNLKTAQALGLRVPDAILAQATEIIR